MDFGDRNFDVNCTYLKEQLPGPEVFSSTVLKYPPLYMNLTFLLIYGFTNSTEYKKITPK